MDQSWPPCFSSYTSLHLGPYYTTTLPRITFYADDTQLYITLDQMVDNAEEQADAAISMCCNECYSY